MHHETTAQADEGQRVSDPEPYLQALGKKEGDEKKPGKVEKNGEILSNVSRNFVVFQVVSAKVIV